VVNGEKYGRRLVARQDDSNRVGASPARRHVGHPAGQSRRTVPIGSGRVGRTRLLTLEQRAELAARADIRRNHTSYEDGLAELYEDDLVGDDWLYREVKTTAHSDVDHFLDQHRQP
jgi:hypothetical protein